MPKLTNPFEGAVPTLRPTAQPMDIGIGATVPSQRSPSAELARAFEGFNSELVSVLKDVAAQQESDAYELGQAKAAEIDASKGMEAAEAKLNKLKDEGVVPASRTPMFERGYRTRYGMAAANVLATNLSKRLNEATRTGNRIDPTAIVAEEREKVFKSSIASGDTYAQVGFTHAAQTVAQDFINRSNLIYAENYRKDADQQAANEGAKLVASWATAPVDLKDTVASAIRGHLDSRRLEIPKGEVNKTFVEQSILPAFQDALTTENFDKARSILSLADFDVKSDGGSTLGRINENSGLFDRMKQQLEAREQETKHKRLDSTHELYSTADADAENDALQVIEAQRSQPEAGPVLYSDIERRTQEYAKGLPRDTIKARKTSMFRSMLEKAWARSTATNQERYKYDVESLLGGMHSLIPSDVEAYKYRLEYFKDINAIEPSRYAAGMAKVQHLQGLASFYDEKDVNRIVSGLYTVIPGIKETTIKFAGNDKELNDAFDKLDDDKKGILQASIVASAQQGIRDVLIKQDNEATAKQAVDQQLPLIQNTVRETALAKLRELAGLQKMEQVQDKITAQAVAIKKAKPVADTHDELVFKAGYTHTESGPSADPAKVRLARMNGLNVADKAPDRVVEGDINVPAGRLYDVINEYSKPPAERDFAEVPIRYSGLMSRIAHGNTTVVDLKALATQINNPEGKPEEIAKSKDLYSFVKSLVLGFTPEEITKGETKHGMKFDASQVDPKRTRVFRTRAELSNNWNGGQPSELFTKVGNAVHSPSMTPEQFYLAQLALLPQ